jgi:hypothetical protein
MEFITHTILYIDETPIYMNVHRLSEHVLFFEILDNPSNLTLEEFTYDLLTSTCSPEMPPPIMRQLEGFVDRLPSISF